MRNLFILISLLQVASLPSVCRSQSLLRRLPPPRLLTPGMMPEQSPEIKAAPEQPVRQDNLRSINPLLVRIEYRNQNWILEGGGLYKDFGSRQEEARQALALIRGLRLDQRGTIGKPNPVIEYWLQRGKAPQGFTTGLRMIRFDPVTLRAEGIKGEWFLRDSRHVLFRFGTHEAEAKHAETVIHKYGFDHVAIIGQARPSMMVFLQRQSVHRAMRPTLTEQGRMTRTRLADMKREWQTKTKKIRSKNDVPIHAALTRVVPNPRDPNGETKRASRSLVIPRKHSLLLNRKEGKPIPQDARSAKLSRTTFTWQHAKIMQENGNWKIKVGSHELANLGTSRLHARRAMAALMYYRLTEHNQVGDPSLGLNYFLALGKAPRGRMQGAFYDFFRPELLKIEKRGRHYFLMAKQHRVLDCGEDQKNAEHLLAVIQHFGFDHVIRIGLTEDHMFKFFVKAY